MGVEERASCLLERLEVIGQVALKLYLARSTPAHTSMLHILHRPSFAVMPHHFFLHVPTFLAAKAEFKLG